MSDEAVVVSSAAPADLTAGMLLRQARQATGLHIAALAVSMKVPVKKLEALEADRLEELPDAVFVRALAASVCRTLKVDSALILSKLPQSAAPKLDKSDRGVSMPLQSPSFLAGNSALAFASKPTVLVVAALLLAAMAVVFFPEARNTMGIAESAKPAPADIPPPEPLTLQVAKDVVLPAAEADKPLLAASNPTAAVPIAAAVPEVVPPVAAPVPAKAASASATVSPDAGSAASGLLVFKAKSRAWIRVSDSKGVVQFEKTLATGESASASGVPPLSVIVGNVAATEVVLRGQPFPLETVTQNNVARFEVK
jgi:cytoskeleton protein RodZ